MKTRWWRGRERSREAEEAWDEVPMGRGIEKWSDSCYILKVGLTGCAEGQAVGRRSREDSRMTSRP